MYGHNMKLKAHIFHFFPAWYDTETKQVSLSAKSPVRNTLVWPLFHGGFALFNTLAFHLFGQAMQFRVRIHPDEIAFFKD